MSEKKPSKTIDTVAPFSYPYLPFELWQLIWQEVAKDPNL